MAKVGGHEVRLYIEIPYTHTKNDYILHYTFLVVRVAIPPNTIILVYFTLIVMYRRGSTGGGGLWGLWGLWGLTNPPKKKNSD